MAVNRFSTKSLEYNLFCYAYAFMMFMLHKSGVMYFDIVVDVSIISPKNKHDVQCYIPILHVSFIPTYCDIIIDNYGAVVNYRPLLMWVFTQFVFVGR